MKNLDKQHEVVNTSLSKFIKEHIPTANMKNVDDIVLQYVISILEEASQDESFDVEAFQEMMSAYVEEFANIEAAVICTWIFELESQLSALDDKKGAEKPAALTLENLSLANYIPEEKLRPRQATNGNSSCNEEYGNKNVLRMKHLSETSDDSNDSGTDAWYEEQQILQEMYPESTSMEIKYCLSIANGDVEHARQIILHRAEMGQSFRNVPRTKNVATKVTNEKELKNRIIERYSYIDQNEPREHRPLAPKVEPKKLVRYRDNKIVSLRGERYTENRDEGSEPRKPKKMQM